MVAILKDTFTLIVSHQHLAALCNHYSYTIMLCQASRNITWKSQLTHLLLLTMNTYILGILQSMVEHNMDIGLLFGR